ncbi:MAG: NTP/NDP exchange transporter [Alphaproteobacteria bacterium]|nr:NTP/NDP exchange transporter [Alphaproteobacteria bacterium]MBP9876867.1 NTP/NDP exchange transporter [Alphaproteobacteria bacterium]
MTTTQNHNLEFSPIRGFLLPIHNHELKKFLPMSFMLCFVLFVYTILRDAKDTLIVTAPGAGPETIPFLKGGIVVPISIALVFLYTKLSNIYSRDTIFKFIVIVLVGYFALFSFVLFPNQNFFHPSPETITNLQLQFPNIKYIFPIWGYWSYTLFYLTAELWSAFMVTLMFWQFANEITRTQEAKRFYTLFGFIAAVAVFIAGFTSFYFSYYSAVDVTDTKAWSRTLQYLASAGIFSGVMIIYLYHWITKNVLTDPVYYDKAESVVKHKEEKPKLSFMESLSYLIHSKYLGFIAILVLSYGVTFGLCELLLKSKLAQQYPNPNEFNAFMGVLSMSTSIAGVVLILFVKNVIARFGWYVGAISTPIILLLTGAPFFFFYFNLELLTPLATLLGLTPLAVFILISMIQNVLTKAFKYSLFDATKEMAYIPLDQELKVKGKAAVDVIGGRLGKGSSGFIVAALLVITAGDITSLAPYIIGCIVFLVAIWMISIKGLNRLYSNIVKD